MADWTTISNSEVDGDSPITESLMTALRDNPQAIAEGATGAPRIENLAMEENVVTAGNVYIARNDAEESHSGTTLTTLKEFYTTQSGTCRILFELKYGTAGTSYARIYINNVSMGTLRSSTSSTYATYTEDFSISVGDYIQLKVYGSEAANTQYIRRFWYGVSNPIIPGTTT
jgi:hypothetical protein